LSSFNLFKMIFCRRNHIMARKILISSKVYVLMTLAIIHGVQSSVTSDSDPTGSTSNEQYDAELVKQLSSVESENQLIDDLSTCNNEICETERYSGKELITKTSSTTGEQRESNSVNDDSKTHIAKKDDTSSEAELKVANQLESLRQIASYGVVKVLKKLDEILEKREKLDLPPNREEEDKSATAASASSASSTSSSTSSSSSYEDAEERLKLASARKLKTELESLVDDALDLVGDKLRRHLKSEISSDAGTDADGTDGKGTEMKDLFRKLEEKSERRKERKSDD